MVYTSMDILVMWIALIYFAIGVFVCWEIVKHAGKDKRINRHNLPLDKYANEHAMEVFLIIIFWPIVLIMLLFALLYGCFIDRLCK